jgi:hypothetical protein
MSDDVKNPANLPAKRDTSRIPMSVPLQKLQVPDKPGWHRHWMLGTPSRIAQAQRAGYRFVDADDADVVSSGIADGAGAHGSTDMGSRVSIVAGSDIGGDGQEQRLYLMEIPEELWQEDQKLLEERNEQIAATIRGGGEVGANPNGSENRYIPDAHRKGVANLFTPKNRRA